MKRYVTCLITLLAHDVWTVYRFQDVAYHYFVRCGDSQSASTLSPVSCGKNFTRSEETQTVAASPVP